MEMTKGSALHSPRFCLVGERGFEPPTSASRTLRANRAALLPESAWEDSTEERVETCRRHALAGGSGARGGTRTPDARLRTAALYPLSYTGVLARFMLAHHCRNSSIFGPFARAGQNSRQPDIVPCGATYER